MRPGGIHGLRRDVHSRDADCGGDSLNHAGAEFRERETATTWLNGTLAAGALELGNLRRADRSADLSHRLPRVGVFR